ncbi:hypothetical protein A2881_02960 [Candidatus Peribacteria bacterium RIFCSPHIGHO2_01_FULL_55_13]|nr:MAG: hypothetical protein A2881_02960 [Candidatus Peribacteria bacterium RIFCSPHIGHO2_01_FULL_55_13]OGJ64557.1 MAG: hypothetical protein A3F36_02320 [Candidatus Peribacteria bacterium RIFCSPHIGHO2_12_FULL_55_11]
MCTAGIGISCQTFDNNASAEGVALTVKTSFGNALRIAPIIIGSITVITLFGDFQDAVSAFRFAHAAIRGTHAAVFASVAHVIAARHCERAIAFAPVSIIDVPVITLFALEGEPADAGGNPLVENAVAAAGDGTFVCATTTGIGRACIVADVAILVTPVTLFTRIDVAIITKRKFALRIASIATCGVAIFAFLSDMGIDDTVSTLDHGTVCATASDTIRIGIVATPITFLCWSFHSAIAAPRGFFAGCRAGITVQPVQQTRITLFSGLENAVAASAKAQDGGRCIRENRRT